MEPPISDAPSRSEMHIGKKDAAAGLQRRWKPVKDVADRAGECWVSADRKRGHELAKIPKAKGGQPYQKKSTGSIKAPVDSPTRAEMHIGKKEAARSEKIAALPFNCANGLGGKTADRHSSRHGLCGVSRQARRVRRVGELARCECELH